MNFFGQSHSLNHQSMCANLILLSQPTIIWPNRVVPDTDVLGSFWCWHTNWREHSNLCLGWWVCRFDGFFFLFFSLPPPFAACPSSVLRWGAHYPELPSHGAWCPAQRPARGGTHRRPVPGRHVHPPPTSHTHCRPSALPQCLEPCPLYQCSSMFKWCRWLPLTKM